MLWELLVIIVFLLLVYYRWSIRNYVRLSKQIKCDLKMYPVIGFTHIFLGNNEDRMNGFKILGEEALKHGGITSGMVAGKLLVTVADPEIIDCIVKTCLQKTYLTKFFQSVIGNGSIFADVSIWRPRRKIIAPIFSLKNLNQFVKIFSKQSAFMVKQLRRKEGKGPFSVWPFLTTYTLDSVCETALGVKMKSQLNPDVPFLKAFEEFCNLASERLVNAWLHFDTVYNLTKSARRLEEIRDFMWDFIDKIIRLKRLRFEENHINQEKTSNFLDKEPENEIKSFLDMYMEYSGPGGGFSEVELREETLVIMMAGTDTSAVAVAFTTMMLAAHPAVQQAVLDELQEVFGSSDRVVMPEDLPRLKYLDAVIKESLRLYPPVPIVTRHIDKEVTLPNGVTLIDGCVGIIHIWSTHRNPNYWGPDANKFRPERFFEPLKHPGQFMPFNFGPRNCLGYQYAMMSAKTALATFLRHYRILPARLPQQKMPSSGDLRVTFDIMMKEANGFMIEIESRNEKNKS